MSGRSDRGSWSAPVRGASPWFRRHRRALLALGIFLFAAMVGVFVLTDSWPAVDARPAPTAAQIGAGRDAANQLKKGGAGLDISSHIEFGPAQLDGLSAMATHGFRPGRLDLVVHEHVFHATASRPLPMGRWLNVNAVARQNGRDFPIVTLSIGQLNFSPYVSRKILDAGRWILVRRGADIPELDRIIRDFTLGKDNIAATIHIPMKTGLIDQLAGDVSGIDPAIVAEHYCRLATLQTHDPQSDFAVQVNRTFSASGARSATPAINQASLIALAMIVVDKRVGYLAGVREGQVANCLAPATPIMLHGRADLPKHWALSAALTVGAGNQLAEAIGEMKEMADSLSSQSQFQLGDPSGFSFVDLAADRSGSKIANAAVSSAHASTMAKRLSVANANQLLPIKLMGYPESIDEEDFRRVYGGIDDPRYAQMVDSIDAALERAGISSAKSHPN